MWTAYQLGAPGHGRGRLGRLGFDLFFVLPSFHVAVPIAVLFTFLVSSQWVFISTLGAPEHADGPLPTPCGPIRMLFASAGFVRNAGSQALVHSPGAANGVL